MKHEFISDPAVASLLDEAEANLDQLTPWQAANLREMRNDWVEATAVPVTWWRHWRNRPMILN